jgi:hypothetical protein
MGVIYPAHESLFRNFPIQPLPFAAPAQGRLFLERVLGQQAKFVNLVLLAMTAIHQRAAACLIQELLPA